MEIVYIPELYFYFSLIVGILGSIFVFVDLFFVKKHLANHIKWTWGIFAVLLFWGPSFFLWIIYLFKYR